MSNLDYSHKNIFVVLGMARSGTSAIARGLNALGIDLGTKLTPADTKWNPKGFFEDNEIVYKINRRVLAEVDFVGQDLSVLAKEFAENWIVQLLKQKAIRLIKNRMANTNYWGFKDPRTAKMVPFWVDIFADLKVNEHYVIALRNPLASAYSYQHVNDIDIEIGLLLWIMHLIQAIDGTQDKKRIIVSFECMMQHPQKELQRIKDYFKLPMLTSDRELELYEKEFLDPSLHHFSYADDALESNPASNIFPICRKMYALFKRLAKDELSFESEEFKIAWLHIKQEFNESRAIYRYMYLSHQANLQLKKQIKVMQKSIPWKIIYPLRKIDDALRKMRRNARQKRRITKLYG